MAEMPDKNKIASLEAQLKMVYGNGQMPQVKTLATDLKALDPTNRLAAHLLEKLAQAEKEVNRKAHAVEINQHQEGIEKAFKAARFDEVERLSALLLVIDPGNSVAQKYRAKIADAKQALEKKQKEALKPKSPSVWSRFAKWASAPKPAKTILQKPALPVKPVSSAPLPLAPVTPPKINTPIIFQTLAAKVDQAPKESNIFTRMFGQKEVLPPTAPSPSIIETIVSKTAQKEIKPAKPPAPKDNTGKAFLRFANAFFQFSLAFVVLSAVFFYAENLDTENRLFSLAGQTNYASRLHQAAAELDKRQEQEKGLNREIKKYEGGYNNRYEKLIKQIVDKRLNWPDILDKINEVTDTVYEKNALSQYIQYNSFSFDAEKGLVRVSGTLSDPLGKNLTKLEELELAFAHYPRDPNNAKDTTEPYFHDVNDFSSLQKTLDRRTGRYTSSFQLSFALNAAATAVPAASQTPVTPAP